MYSWRSQLSSYIEEFIEYRCTQGYSRNTYEPILRDLDRFYFTNHPTTSNLNHSIIMEWLKRKSKESQSYLKSRASVVRQLGRYMCDKGLKAYVVPEKFITSRKTSAAYIFTDDELNRLFRAIDTLNLPDDNLFAEYELPVLFRLIYTCGLRPQEGRNLECKHINTETGEIFITNTKRNRDRIVVMSQDMLELYRQYDEKRGMIYPESLYAFPAPQGNIYSSQWLGKQFSRCWALANPVLSKDELPHVRIYDLRHRFASAVLNRWLDESQELHIMLPYLQAFMGHSELSSTAQYIHLIPETLIKTAGINWDSMCCLIPEVQEC